MNRDDLRGKIPEEMKQKALQWMPDLDFFDLMQGELRFNVERIKEGTDSFIPRLMIISADKDKDGKRELIPVFFAEFGDDRHKMMMGLGAKFAMDKPKFQPAAVCMTTEAWIRQAKSDKEYQEHINSGKRVSDYDDKEECLITFGCTFDFRQQAINIPIKRDDKGNIIDQKPKVMGDSVENYLLHEFFKGYFMGLMIKHKKV